MVNNAQVEREFAMFSDIWGIFKELHPVSGWEDEAYWDKVVESIKSFMSRHPDTFSHDIAIAVLEEIERKSRAAGAVMACNRQGG